MRILVVGINYTPDMVGVAKYNTELCETLASFGHEVRVITAPPYYPNWSVPAHFRGLRYRSEEINAVSITRSPIYVPRSPTGAKRLLHHASFALTSMWPVVSASYRWRPDVVFSVAPSLMSAACASWIGHRTGALTWLHVQDFEVDAAFGLGLLSGRRMRALMEAIERKILQSFDCVSTISPQMVEGLAAKGVDPEKVWEIRNWTDTRKLALEGARSQFPQELGLNDSHFVGLYSGTMSNKQGLDLIIAAARSLDQPGSKIRFILCGEGPDKENLQRQAAGLTNVQFLGLQAEDSFVALLRAADVHLIPQKAEAADLVLPSKLGGILASGKPVIVMASPGTGLAEEVGSGGLVIPPADADALAYSVHRLSRDPALCHSLGRSARTIALGRWDKAKTLRALEQALISLTDSKMMAKQTNLSSLTDARQSPTDDALRQESQIQGSQAWSRHRDTSKASHKQA